MSNVSHADQSEREYRGERHSEDGGSYGQPSEGNTIEWWLRATAGVIGSLLIVLTVQHVTQPPLAADTIELFQSATGQWLAVAVLAVVLLFTAVRGHVR